MITGIDFVSLPVVDMARAKAFYQDTLGLTPGGAANDAWVEFDQAQNLGISTADAWVEFDLGDGPALALVDAAAYGMPSAPIIAGSIALAMRDFEGMVKRFKEQGRLKKEPFESPVCHGAFVVDTEGNSLALHRRKSEPNRDRVIDFVALPIENMARARAFYEEVLGLTPETIHENVWTEYVLPDDSALALGDTRAMGIDFTPTTGGAVGLRTPDLEAAFTQLKALGHATAEELFETPACFMGFARDSEGNALVLHRRK
jgi:predicted enzyme related to lactoylglutathione lyase